MRRYVLHMERYGIGPERMRELAAVCRQYPSLLRALNDVRQGVKDGPEKGGGPGRIHGDPTASRAARAADSWARRRVRIIERAAEAAGGRGLSKALLRNVTRGLSWERLGPPCGRRQFYEARRRFFLELDERLKEE